MVKVRSRPVVKEAVKWTGENVGEVLAFLGHNDEPAGYWNSDTGLHIFTLEGEMHASQGDWIVQGVNGEFYPVKPDIFVKTYEMWTDAEKAILRQ